MENKSLPAKRDILILSILLFCCQALKGGGGMTIKSKSRQGFENFILIVVRTENGTT